MENEPITTHFVDVRLTVNELGELCDLIKHKTDFFRNFDRKLHERFDTVMTEIAHENVSIAH